MTDEQKKTYFEKVEQNIKNSGYHLTYVLENESPSFCYSTGIYKSFKIPELFISSLPQGLCSEIVANYVDSFKGNQIIPINEKVDHLIKRFWVYLIEVLNLSLTDYVLSSIQFYKDEDYKYLQVVYPDINGCFPNDVGYDYDQIILGEFKN